MKDERGLITDRQTLAFVEKQAENGLQSRSSENGKTAVWYYDDWHG